MINLTLYKRELKKSVIMIIIFAALLSMYIPIIVYMYNPDMSKIIDQFKNYMPKLMSAMGLDGSGTSLVSFMSSNLYGMILIIFPMIFCIIKANGLIAKYTEATSMVSLLAAPVKRTTLCITQILTLISDIIILILYSSILEIAVCKIIFPDINIVKDLLLLNIGLLFLQMFIGSICFLCSCIFNDTKYSLGISSGITVFMYLLKMLGNMSEDFKILKDFSFFSLYNPLGLINRQGISIGNIFILLFLSIILFIISVFIFKKKDMHI